MSPKHLKLSFEKEGRLLRVRINRPEVRNAFNEELIADYQAVFAALSSGEG